MRKTMTLAAAAALAALPLAHALAQPGPGSGPRGPERMFERLDTDRDGRVTREEAMARLAERFAQADADRDGGVSLAEFQAAPLRAGAVRPGDAGDGRRADRRAAMFRALDANSDGRVTLEEARPAAEARFRAADANGDGAITREEVAQRHAHRGGPGPHRGDQPQR